MINIDSFAHLSFARAFLVLRSLFLENCFRSDDQEEHRISKMFASYLGVNFQDYIFAESARGALFLAINEAKNTKNKVILPGFTCVALVNVFLAKGYEVILLDIELETYSLQLDTLENYLSKHADQVAILVLQWTFGMMPKNRSEILQICEKYDISLIEDLAHGFDPSTLKSLKLAKSEKILFSFGRSKFISAGGGGLLLNFGRIDYEKVMGRKIQFRQVLALIYLEIFGPLIKSTYHLFLGRLLHYISVKLQLIKPEVSSQEKNGCFDRKTISKISMLQLRLLDNALQNIPELIKLQNQVCRKYDQIFAYLFSPNIRTHYPLLVQSPIKIKEILANDGIFLSSWYTTPVAGMIDAMFQEKVESINLINSSKICKHVISLPVNENLSDKYLEILKSNQWK